MNCKFDTEIACIATNTDVGATGAVTSFVSPEPVFWSVTEVPLVVEDKAELEVAVVTGLILAFGYESRNLGGSNRFSSRRSARCATGFTPVLSADHDTRHFSIVTSGSTC